VLLGEVCAHVDVDVQVRLSVGDDHEAGRATGTAHGPITPHHGLG
jgi:hypothetical protein